MVWERAQACTGVCKDVQLFMRVQACMNMRGHMQPRTDRGQGKVNDGQRHRHAWVYAAMDKGVGEAYDGEGVGKV